MDSELRHDEVEEIVAAWQREMPEVDAGSIRIVTPIWRLSAALRTARETTLAKFELDQSRLSVLGTLRRAGRPYRLTSGELTRRCRVTAGATSQRVDRLEADGYVERVREESDRRTVHVQLTDAGSRKLDDVFAAVIAADEQVLTALPDENRVQLARILGDWIRSAELDFSAPDFRR